MTQSYYAKQDVLKKIARSERTLRYWMSTGEFPRPDFKVDSQNFWYKNTVDAWKPIEEQPVALPEKHTESGDKATVEYTSVVRIRTLDDALKHAEVDLKTWYVDRWECTSWEIGMKLRQGVGPTRSEKPLVQPLWRVSLHLRRILPQPFLEASRALFDRMAKHAPKYPLKVPAKRPENYLLEIDLFDTHFGKLAWAPETGEDYDLKIAETIYQNAVEDLMAICKGFEPTEIVLPIGNDFYHIDTQEGTTTAGTRVDTDGRYAKIIEVGEIAIIRAIDYMIQFAPVKVIWIPGNHDRIASYHLSRTLRAWYRNTKSVEVDCGPSVRKYLRWGTNLIGYTHGHEEKKESLPLVMATERQSDWAVTQCHEWRIGHEHRSKKLVTTDIDTVNGVAIRTLQSLSATDEWHHRKGYVGTRRVAEAHICGFVQGYVGHFNVQARSV